MESIFLLYKNNSYKFAVQNEYQDRFYTIYFPQIFTSEAIIPINNNLDDANSVFEYAKDIFENETNGLEFDDYKLLEIVDRIKNHIETNFHN